MDELFGELAHLGLTEDETSLMFVLNIIAMPSLEPEDIGGQRDRNRLKLIEVGNGTRDRV